MREPPSDNRFQWPWQLRHFLRFSIRSKIILPYLILTLVVAVIGTYVVTKLVASSLDERLTNHLLEAGRVVSDTLVRQELSHLEEARIIAFTRGLAEAVEDHDAEAVLELARPTAMGLDIENLIIVDADGDELVHLLRQSEGALEPMGGEFDASDLWTIQALLEADDPGGVPRRAVGLHPADDQHYYFTAIPISLDGELVGVISVGTSLSTLVPEFKSTSLADVTIYLDGGRAVASTFMIIEESEDVDEPAGIEQFSIPPEAYNETLRTTEITMGENMMIHGRWYRLARGPLQVGNETLGVFSVALPSHFIISAGTASRNTYALLFALTAGAVIGVGYLISQRIIINPLGRLVRTSKAVADGNLEQRTGIGSSDEIGELASTFDQMTERLLERTRALEELMQNYKEAAGRMRAILSSIGDGVLLEDLEGNLIPLNEVAEELLDELSENFQLGPLRDLTSDDSEHGAEEDVNPWLVESRRFEVGRKMISTHSAAVRTDDGDRLGTVIVLRDVTAEVEADRLKDAFVAHVSHELRTPLTAIKGYIALLRSRAGSSLSKEELVFLDIVSRHTDNLVTMIDELLDFSEMEAKGRLGLRRQPILLSELIEEIAKEWRPQMEEKELDFRVEIPSDIPMVDADSRRLRWALINMVRNAWQYTPEGGEVTLRSSLYDGKVIVDVVDTGIGISPEDQERIFDRFKRIDQDSDDIVRGLGLGLYISNAIVEAHGGKIEIISKEGAGSTFSVILPTLQSGQGSKRSN